MRHVTLQHMDYVAGRARGWCRQKERGSDCPDRCQCQFLGALTLWLDSQEDKDIIGLDSSTRWGTVFDPDEVFMPLENNECKGNIDPLGHLTAIHEMPCGFVLRFREVRRDRKGW